MPSNVKSILQRIKKLKPVERYPGKYSILREAMFSDKMIPHTIYQCCCDCRIPHPCVFMVKNELFKKAGFKTFHGQICAFCFCDRIQRNFRESDFGMKPCNVWIITMLRLGFNFFQIGAFKKQAQKAIQELNRCETHS